MTYVIIANGVGITDFEYARFAFEDDAKVFLASLRRRKPWNDYRLEERDA